MTTNTAIDIGSTTITTLGTITTGVWNGTAVTVPNGGTGNTSFTAYSVILQGTTSTSAMTNVSGLGVLGQVLTSNDVAAWPTWKDIAVGGISNRITVSTVSHGPVIDISSAYVGQTSLTTLGTITTGVWNGSLIPLAYGGTNANLTASNGGIFYSTASAGAILSGTATANQVLLSGASTTPAWSTATYPATTTINQLLYSSAANTISGLSTANNGVLLTSGSGVPSIGTATVAVGGTGNTTFTAYSVICAGTTATGAFQNVSGVGSSGQVLTSNGASALPTWQASAIIPWVDQTSTSVTMAVNTAYVADNSGLVTLTLPATAALGSVFQVVGKGAGGWKIGQAASQTINIGNQVTTSGTGGSLASSLQYDCVQLVCVTANTVFVVYSSYGNITYV